MSRELPNERCNEEHHNHRDQYVQRDWTPQHISYLKKLNENEISAETQRMSTNGEEMLVRNNSWIIWNSRVKTPDFSPNVIDKVERFNRALIFILERRKITLKEIC